MRSSLRLSFLALTLTCALPSQSRGQCGRLVVGATSYKNDAWNAADYFAGPLLSLGYRPLRGDTVGWACGSEWRGVTQALSARTEYVVVAGCDRDCGGLELRIRGPDGSVTAEDTGQAARVRFTTEAEGNHSIELRMTNCRLAPCFWAVRLLESSAVPLAVADPRSRRVVAGLTADFVRRGYRPADSSVMVGWSWNTRTTVVKLALHPGTPHAVVAACDLGDGLCAIDLAVREPAGAPGAADTTPGPSATVQFATASLLEAAHAIAVRMRRCPNALCTWALRVLERPAGLHGAAARRLRSTVRVVHREPLVQPVRINDSLVGYTPVTADVPAGQITVQVGWTRLCVRTAPGDSAYVRLAGGRVEELRSASRCDDPAAPPAAPTAPSVLAQRNPPIAPPPYRADSSGATPFTATIAGSPGPFPVEVAQRGLYLEPRGLPWDSAAVTRYRIRYRNSRETYAGGAVREVGWDAFVSAVVHRTPDARAFLLVRYDSGSMNLRNGYATALPFDSMGGVRAVRSLVDQPIRTLWGGIELDQLVADGLGDCLAAAGLAARRGGPARSTAWEHDTTTGPAAVRTVVPDPGRAALPVRPVRLFHLSHEWLQIARDSGGVVLTEYVTSYPEQPSSRSLPGREGVPVNEDRRVCRFASDGALQSYARVQEAFDRGDIAIREKWYELDVRRVNQ